MLSGDAMGDFTLDASLAIDMLHFPVFSIIDHDGEAGFVRMPSFYRRGDSDGLQIQSFFVLLLGQGLLRDASGFENHRLVDLPHVAILCC